MEEKSKVSHINYLHTQDLHNSLAAREVLPFIFSIVKPLSVLDIGCGTGSWLKISKELGVNEVLGIDGILVDQTILDISKEEFKLHNLGEPLNLSHKYNLAICLEVAEHLPEEGADNIIDILTKHSDIILFSAAIPGQGGQYHINEQWPDYWQEKFNKKGYLTYDILRDKFWNNKNVKWWYRQNMFIYSKSDTAISTMFQPTYNLNKYVHPELFFLKEDEVNNLRKVVKETIWYPKIFPTLRLLAKSLLK